MKWASLVCDLLTQSERDPLPGHPAKPVGLGQGGNRIAGPASHFPGVGLVRWPVTKTLNWGKTEIMPTVSLSEQRELYSILNSG